MIKRVLLVEDHDSLRQLLGVFLSQKFEVVSARNGLEAMGWLSRGCIPDVIVTDLRMPEMDGTELITHLCTSGLYADIPVVVISGAADADESWRLLQAGVADFMTKPFSPLALQDRLLELVHGASFPTAVPAVVY